MKTNIEGEAWDRYLGEFNEDNQFARGQDGGTVWNRLHAEREEICEALLGNARRSEPMRTTLAGPHFSERTIGRRALDGPLQARLLLIDNALDRLMTGSYGDCVKCGRWIEDTKLHADPALPFCLECEPEPKDQPPFPVYVNPNWRPLSISHMS